MDRPYGKIEADSKLEQVIKYLDARQRVAIFVLDNYNDSIADENTDSRKIQEINYVYDLFDNKHRDIMENFVIDYIRFDFDYMVIGIKPNKYYK